MNVVRPSEPEKSVQGPKPKVSEDLELGKFGGLDAAALGGRGQFTSAQRDDARGGALRPTSAPQTADASGMIQFHDLFPPPTRAFYRTVQQ